MLGAIIGDICGSRYEFHNRKGAENVELFAEGCHPTDDSVMTCAVARALIGSRDMPMDYVKNALIDSMHYYGGIFPGAGYGGSFKQWLKMRMREPYNSWGNGAGMRVAAVGWLYDTLEETLKWAAVTADVTHNHPEGIKGAQAIAACVFLARTGSNKDEIREYVNRNFYKLDFTLDSIRDTYHFDVSCQGSCPQAIEAFLEGEGFVDVIRKAISIGGDSDTIAAMAGGIAEAFYGIPQDIEDVAFEILTNAKVNGLVYNNAVLARDVKEFRQYCVDRGSRWHAAELDELKIAELMWTMALGDGNRRMNGESPLPDKSVVATGEGWNVSEMPAEYSDIPCQLKLAEEDFEILKRGHAPEVMEDHWAMYCDTDAQEFRYYRSWSGYCIFAAHYVELSENDAVIDRIRCNRNKEQHNGDRESDWYLFQALIEAEVGRDDSSYLNRYINCMLRK